MIHLFLAIIDNTGEPTRVHLYISEKLAKWNLDIN